MPLPCPPDVNGDNIPDPVPGEHQISLLDIQNEFGGTYLNNSYTRINEYYRGGEYVPDIPENERIPSTVGQQISFADFFCSSSEYVIIIGNSENVNVKNLFGSTIWSSEKAKRLIVSFNAVIGPSISYGLPVSNPNGYAMTITNDFGGVFTLENRGSIQGAGGRGGGSSILTGESRTNKNNGGDGGNAIYIGGGNKTVRIRNFGGILGGGGGGGAAFASGSATQNYSYQSDKVTISLTTNGAALGGGLGRGYKQARTDSSTATGGFSYNITFSSNNWASREMYYPPNSTITITNTSAYTRNMYFGSGSSITINQISSGIGNVGTDGCIYNNGVNTGTCGNNFSGNGLGGVYLNGSGSTISFSLRSSGVYQLTKDPNQSYVVNGVVNRAPSYPDNIYTVNNVSGGGPQTTVDYIDLNGNWGSLRTTMPVATPLPGSTASPGAGGDWGKSGGTSTGNIIGGASGYAVVNANSYVNWLIYGTVLGTLS